MASLFTVDWETWFNAVIPRREWHKYDLDIEEPTEFLLDILDKYNVKAVFYVLGWLRAQKPSLYYEIEDRGHTIGDHGYWHEHNEHSTSALFRSPYWDTTPMPWPPSGGFFFRAMPYWYIKWAIENSGQFWIHPHDIMLDHPKLQNPALNFKRQTGLKESRLKLERLIQELEWYEP